MTKREAAAKMKAAKKMLTLIKEGHFVGGSRVCHIENPNTSLWDGDERYYPPPGYFGTVYFGSSGSADPYALTQTAPGQFELT